MAGLELPIALSAVTAVMMFGVFCLMGLTYMNRQNKILKASSPGLLMVSLIGILLLYGEIIVVAFCTSTLTCMLRAWLRHFGFILTYSGLLFKTWRISVIMRAFNSRLFQTRDVELYKRIGAVTAVGVVVLVLWSSVDPAPVVSHPPAPKQIIYSRQCQLNLWNIGLVTAEFIYLVWGGVLCFQARKAPALYNETKLVSYVVWNEGLWLIFMLIVRLLLYRHPDPEMLLIVSFMRTHLTSGVILVVVFGSKFYVIFRNVRQLRGTLTDVYGPRRVHRMSLMVNKNGEIKTIHCVPCGPLTYIDSSDVEEDDHGSQENGGQMKEDVYTKDEVDALIEMVTRLKGEKEVYKVQTQRLLQILKFKRFKETHTLPPHTVTEEADLSEMGINCSILPTGCSNCQNDQSLYRHTGAPPRSGRASTVTTYISSSPDSMSWCENANGIASPPTTTINGAGEVRCCELKPGPNLPLLTNKPTSRRTSSVASPRDQHDMITWEDAALHQFSPSASSSKKSDDTEEFPKLINSSNSNNNKLHVSNGIIALCKANVCSHPALADAMHETGGKTTKTVTSQGNSRLKRVQQDQDKPNFIMYI